MKFLRMLRRDWRFALLLLFGAIWTLTAIGIQIGYIVAHHRFPISEYEVINWLFGLAP